MIIIQRDVEKGVYYVFDGVRTYTGTATMPCVFESPYNPGEWTVYEPYPRNDRKTTRTYNSKAEAFLDAIEIHGALE